MEDAKHEDQKNLMLFDATFLMESQNFTVFPCIFMRNHCFTKTAQRKYGTYHDWCKLATIFIEDLTAMLHFSGHTTACYVTREGYG
jgi:hypothetical protein